eukprot:1160867-Pelagomonas_calceolata.AAC.8
MCDYPWIPCHDGLNLPWSFSTGAFLWGATAACAISSSCMGQAHVQCQWQFKGKGRPRVSEASSLAKWHSKAFLKLQVHNVRPGSSVTFAVAHVRLQRAPLIVTVPIGVKKSQCVNFLETLFRAKRVAVPWIFGPQTQAAQTLWPSMTSTSVSKSIIVQYFHTSFFDPNIPDQARSNSSCILTLIGHLLQPHIEYYAVCEIINHQVPYRLRLRARLGRPVIKKARLLPSPFSLLLIVTFGKRSAR